jgi:small subunit ribosomal protein S1
MSESEIPTPHLQAAAAEFQPPVDPKDDPEMDREIHPAIDPEPEGSPLAEPGPEPEPIDDPKPEPDEDPAPEPDPEPLPNESQSAEHRSAEPKSAAPEVVAAPVTEAVEPAEPEESFADIFSEFQRTHSHREPGSAQLHGTIVAVTADSVLVDIGFKSEGILPLTAFTARSESPKVGDGVQVSVKGRDEDGYYALSLFKTAQPKDWTGLEQAFAERSTIVGTVTGVVKGGLHVDVGVRAFLPASRSGTRDAAEMEKLVGEEVRVRITKLDVADEDVVVDRRVVSEEEALAGKARRQAELSVGAVLDGTVRTLTDYGAFVELGGVDGLLHISDVAWTRVTKIDDVLSVGQQLEVKILKIDPESGKISLGLKQLQPHPWDAVAATYAVGDRVHGVVSRIADFGAFVELAPGIEGLVHLSAMSWSKRIHKATEVVKVGDVVDTVILSIEPAERRIALGLKQALGDPWAEIAMRIGPGAMVEGPVSSITKFGAFVEVAEGVQGLVHISEIVPDRRLNHPSDVLHTGQVVKAVVLELDKEKRQMRLSMKQLIPTSLDEFLGEHKVGDAVTGRIASIEAGVAVVELGEGILSRCKLPAVAAAAPAAEPVASAKVDLAAFSSLLKDKWKTGAAPKAAKSDTRAGADAPAAGQVRNFRIVAMDASGKRVDVELAD